MKNVLISLIALAAISGTAFAFERGNDSDNGMYIHNDATASSALVVVKKKKLTAFERMVLTSQDDDHGDNRSNRGGQE